MNPVIQFIVEHAAECIVGAVILIAFGMLYGLIWRTVKSERPEKQEKDAAIDPGQHASPSRDDMAAAKPSPVGAQDLKQAVSTPAFTPRQPHRDSPTTEQLNN